MAKELWLCRTRVTSLCNTRNPGRVKVCGNCGAPQPKDVEFHQAKPRTKSSPMLKGLEMAAGGPDIHCYCTRAIPATPSGVRTAAGDLTGGEQRESGQIIGAPNKSCARHHLSILRHGQSATNAKCKIAARRWD